jgi:nucleoside-diphosphate-sugar epimerase
MTSRSDALAADLEDVLERTRDLWFDLAHARLLITGGTGFFGSWLLESFTRANDRLGLGAKAVVLTRDSAGFMLKAPDLAGHDAIEIVQADIRRPPAGLGLFDAVVHAATDASADLNRNDPLTMIDTIVEGTRRILEVVDGAGPIPLLFTSSGAVYGRQPPDVARMSEDWTGGPDPLEPASAYAEGKRLAELLGAISSTSTDLQVKVARCYAFVGPYLPLDRHFAIGNFIHDGLGGGPICVQGDGTAVRSYLYASDLTVWLWTILLRGQTGRAYNVGSEEATDIAGLARTVAATFNPAPVVEIGCANQGRPVDRYVPNTQRARTELGLEQTIALEEAVDRTVDWYRAR